MLCNLISFTGIAVLIALAWLFSANRKNFNRRVVLWGVGIQPVFGLFIFKIPAGCVSQIGVHVLMAATFVCMRLPCVAETFFSDGSILFNK